MVMAWVLAGSLALGLAPGAALDVLVLPVTPMEASLAGASLAVQPTLMQRVRALRGVETRGVRQEHVALDATPQTAMACLAWECAAEMARMAGTQQAVWPVLRRMGTQAQLTLWRVDRSRGVVKTVQRRVALDRAGTLAPLVPDMVVELFPDFRAGPLLEAAAPPQPAAVCAPVELAAASPSSPDLRVSPMPELGFLLPAAMGAALAGGLLILLGALPTLLATGGLWMGTVYLLSVLWSTLQHPVRDGTTNRVMVQGMAVTTLMWPVITVAPLVMLAPLVTTAVAVVASRIPAWLWARKAAPVWFTAAAVALPSLLVGALALIPLGAGLGSVGAYVAPWVSQQHPKLQAQQDNIILAAVLGVGAGAVLAYAGAGLAALLVVGSSLALVPTVTALSLLWDNTPLREPGEQLPVDTLLKDSGGPSWRRR